MAVLTPSLRARSWQKATQAAAAATSTTTMAMTMLPAVDTIMDVQRRAWLEMKATTGRRWRWRWRALAAGGGDGTEELRGGEAGWSTSWRPRSGENRSTGQVEKCICNYTFFIPFLMTG